MAKRFCATCFEKNRKNKDKRKVCDIFTTYMRKKGYFCRKRFHKVSHIMSNTTVNELNLNIITQLSISSGIRYFDGDAVFVDNVKTVPELKHSFVKTTFETFVFCLEGTLSLTVNDKSHSLTKHDVMFVGQNTIVGDIVRSDDFDCKIIIVTPEFGLNFINKTIFDTIMKIQAHPIIKLTPEEIDLMMRYYELAVYKFEHPSLNYGRETMLNLLRSMALDLLSSISQHNSNGQQPILRQGDKIFNRFIMLLSGNETNNRSVQYYADQLCISSKYLTSICNQKANQTAGEIIASHLVGRIKQLLLYSGKSIKEIAVEMGFENLSFFGKYVKKHLGDSPNRYRKKHAVERESRK